MILPSITMLFMLLSSLPCEGATQSNRVMKRQFLPLPGSYGKPSPLASETQSTMIRVMQFNVLADGLSGLREDRGRFSRVTPQYLDWNYRKDLLMEEIRQYDADIITLQEVDHYYDFFLRNLRPMGYVGFFAPKPTSKCLEVTNRADGCALFLKTSKLRVTSCETRTLALSKADMTDTGEILEDDIRVQNQVALFAVCEVLSHDANSIDSNLSLRPSSSALSSAQKEDAQSDQLSLNLADEIRARDILEGYKSSTSRTAGSGSLDKRPPPIIVCTSHLKSVKSATGERYRQRAVVEILKAIDRQYVSLTRNGRIPAVLFTGDFNAVPENSIYEPLTYRAVKTHSLGLRSVYNEDLGLSPQRMSGAELYTTWKARRRGTSDKEMVIKRCIDYIFYKPFKASTVKSSKVAGDSSSSSSRSSGFDSGAGSGRQAGGAALTHADRVRSSKAPLKSPVVASSSEQIAISLFLRFIVYFFGALIPLTSLISTQMSTSERWGILVGSLFAIVMFELRSEGSVFKPLIAANIANSATDVEVKRKRRSFEEKQRRKELERERLQELRRREDQRVRLEEQEQQQKEQKEQKVQDKISFSSMASVATEGVKNGLGAGLEASLDTLRQSEAFLFRSVASLGLQLQPLPQYGTPGFQACAAVDIFSDEEIGLDFLPSARYPSDHIALVADLRLMWEPTDSVSIPASAQAQAPAGPVAAGPAVHGRATADKQANGNVST